MSRVTAVFASLVLTALSLGASWSHVLQIRGKAVWPGPLWRAAMESLYRDYAIVGGVASYRDRWEMWHAVIAALKLAAFSALAIGVQKV